MASARRPRPHGRVHTHAEPLSLLWVPAGPNYSSICTCTHTYTHPILSYHIISYPVQSTRTHTHTHTLTHARTHERTHTHTHTHTHTYTHTHTDAIKRKRTHPPGLGRLKRKKPHLTERGIKPERTAEKNTRHLWKLAVVEEPDPSWPPPLPGGPGGGHVRVEVAGNGFLYRYVLGQGIGSAWLVAGGCRFEALSRAWVWVWVTAAV